MYDPYTYGDSKACIALAKFLNEMESEWLAKKVNRKVSTLLDEYNSCLKELKLIQNSCVKSYIAQLLFTSSKERIDGYEIPDKVKSLVKNILTFYRRKFMLEQKLWEFHQKRKE